MEEVVVEKKEIFKNIIVLIGYIIIYCGLSKINRLEVFEFKFIHDSVLRGKVQETIYLIIIAIMSYVIIKIITIIRRIAIKPISIEVEMKDLLKEKDYTDVYFTDGNNEITSKFKMKIKILNTKSLTKQVMKCYIKDKKIKLVLGINPSTNCITFQPEKIINKYDYMEIDEVYFFTIDLSELIKSNLRRSIYLMEEHKITIVKEDEDAVSGNCEYAIKPYILINGKEPNFIIRKFIKTKIKCNDEYYKINIIIDKGQ